MARTIPRLFRKTARHVDKILKGAKPADLPVEEPTEYELVINLQAPKSIGLTYHNPFLPVQTTLFDDMPSSDNVTTHFRVLLTLAFVNLLL